MPTSFSNAVVCLVHFQCNRETTTVIRAALIECFLPEEGETERKVEIVAADFFDDECMVVVLRVEGGKSSRGDNVVLIVIEKFRTDAYCHGQLQRFRVSRASARRIRNYTRPRRFDAGGDTAVERRSCRFHAFFIWCLLRGPN
jgi:hypothetical protein